MSPLIRRISQTASISDRQAGHAPAPFVIGVSRSGTTLLRLMLDAHPDLAIPPETYFLYKTMRDWTRAPDARTAFLEVLTSHRRWTAFHIDGAALEERLDRLDTFNLGDGLRAFYTLYSERFGKSRWG